MKNKKVILFIGLIIGVITSLKIIFPKFEIVFNWLLIIVFIITILVALIFFQKMLKVSETSQNSEVTLWRNYQLRMKKMKSIIKLFVFPLTGIVFFLLFGDLISKSNKYVEIIGGLFVLFLFGIIVYLFYVIITDDIKYMTIDNIEQKDDWIKEYENYLLSKAKEYFNAKESANIRVKCKLEYFIKDEINKKKILIGPSYSSYLNINVYNGDHLLFEDSLLLVNIDDKKAFGRYFISYIYLNEINFINEINKRMGYFFEDNYHYYENYIDLVKELDFNILNNIQYYSLYSQENIDNVYYQYYFKLIKSGKYKNLEEMMLSKGIDYTKPYYLSCSKEKDKKVCYELIYKCFINNLENRVMQSTIDSSEIVISVDENDKCNMVIKIICNDKEL